MLGGLTMRKRCHRKHHDPGAHPCLAPAGLVGDHQGLALREELSFAALAAGTGQAADVAVMVLTAKVARLLAAQGFGAEHTALIDRAERVLAGADDDAPQALRDLLGLTAAQREVCSHQRYLAALGQAARLQQPEVAYKLRMHQEKRPQS